MYSIFNFKKDADLFNEVSGQATKCSEEDLLNQYDLMEEEMRETKDGFNKGNPVEVLDGVIDTLYVTLGLLQKLKNLGVDTDGALEQVAEDNLSKFVGCEILLEESLDMYKKQGKKVLASYNEEHEVWVLKNTTDKVCKPSNFKSTNLSKYVPDVLKERGFSYEG